MKTQKYLVTIEMPDGDMIGPGWIKDLIEADCDVEDVGRHKVSVEEIKAEEMSDKTLDEAAHEYACTKSPYGANAFKAGAKWMATQGILRECVVEEGKDIGFSMANPFNEGDNVIIQIRKK